MNKEYSLVHVFDILKKWKKRILISTLVMTLLAVIFSLFMDDYYKSTALAYPANEDLAKPIPLGSFDRGSDYYGASHELDRLLTIAESKHYILAIIDKFDLYDHYEIKKENARSEFHVITKFRSLYEVTKTKYDALQIGVEDTDPVMAKNMVAFALDLLDTESQNFVKGNQSYQSEALQNSLKEKERRHKVLNDSLNGLRNTFGVLNADRQGEILSEMASIIKANLNEAEAKYTFYKTKGISRDSTNKYNAARTGFASKLEAIQSDIAKFNEGSTKISSVEKQIRFLQDQLSYDSERLNQINTAISTKFPSMLIIQEPTTPSIKSRPKRTMIILGVAMFAFFLSCFVVLVLESYKSMTK